MVRNGELLTNVTIALDLSPVVITGWLLLFIHKTPGLRQMGLIASRVHYFDIDFFLGGGSRGIVFWGKKNMSCRLSKNKMNLN